MSDRPLITVELTTVERNTLVFALGSLMGLREREGERRLSHEEVRYYVGLANKLGCDYPLPYPKKEGG